MACFAIPSRRPGGGWAGALASTATRYVRGTRPVARASSARPRLDGEGRTSQARRSWSTRSGGGCARSSPALGRAPARPAQTSYRAPRDAFPSLRCRLRSPSTAAKATPIWDTSWTHLQEVSVLERKNPAFAGLSRADGIRTHELLHGKRVVDSVLRPGKAAR
jgi:hypothetical protein